MGDCWGESGAPGICLYDNVAYRLVVRVESQVVVSRANANPM